MAPFQGPESHSTNNGTPMIGLFIIVGAVVIGFPIVIVIALVARRCLDRRRVEEQRRAHHQLKDFKLQSTPQRPRLISMSKDVSSPSSTVPKNFSTHGSLSTPSRTGDRARSRLSRPLSLPIRKSILQLQSGNKPVPSPKSGQTLEHPRCLSTISACSSPSTYAVQTSSGSPISPISSTAPLNISTPQIAAPEAAHIASENASRWSHHATRDRNSRWKPRLIKTFTPLTDLKSGRDLFINNQDSDTKQYESRTNIGYVDAQKGESSTTRIRKGQVNVGIPVRVEVDSPVTVGISVDTEQVENPMGRVSKENAEWQHARLETVDGVLAPREWL